MTQLSPTALEAAAKAIFKRSIYHGYDDETIASEWARTSYLHRNVATAAITAYLAQREKEGWVMVPLNPTDDMIEAGCANNPTQWNEGTDLGFAADVANDVYRAMLAQNGGEPCK